MIAKKATVEAGPMVVPEVKQGTCRFHLVGETPLVYNAVSEKARRELLLPRRKTKADRAASYKHDPRSEFRSSVYTSDDGPSRLVLPSTMFKAALRDVAKDLPGMAKSEVGRMTYVVGDTVPLYGVPKLKMDVVRNSDMNRTPDIRTRAIIPEWCVSIDVKYMIPFLNPQAITNLLSAAGVMRGVGDWRVEKGSGNFGSFRIANKDDVDFARISKLGRKVQEAALKDAEPYDTQSRELLAYWDQRVEELQGKAAVDHDEDEAEE